MLRLLRSLFRLPRLLRRRDMLLVLLVLVISAFLHLRYNPGSGVLGTESLPVSQSELRHLEPIGELDESRIPAKGEPFCFLMVNANNYFVEGEKQRAPYRLTLKKEESREALAEVIAARRPAVVGLLEMGGPLALQDLRTRLKKRGLEYPYFRILVRDGEARAVAVLSALPLVRDYSRADYGLYDNTHRRKMLRGILDVTVRSADGRLFRIIGAHLKSHVADDARAADSLRAKEAATLAGYLQRAMKEQPRIPIAVFGDWNDNPDAPTLQVLRQGLSAASALTLLRPTDSRGEGWTLYYRGGNEYCTYDHIYVNKVLNKRLGNNLRCGVVDIPAAAKASDHRAVWCELR